MIAEDGLDRDTVEDDKSHVLKNSVVAAFRYFCTSRNGVVDDRLLSHCLERTTCWASDRCPSVLKAARMMRSEECRALEFVFRDPCHILRTVCSVVSDSFSTSEAVLFGDRTSVIPSIMNSHEWQSRFLWMQRLCAEHPSFQGVMKAGCCT